MLSLAQAARLRTDDGERLPVVWNAFAEKKIVFRRGLLHLVASAPGGFKSTLITNYLIQARVRALFFSLDTDANTVCARVVAAATWSDLDTAERGYLNRELWAMQALAAVDWITYAFPASPDVVELGEHVLAYAEAHGDFPEMVVVDNLGNVAGASSDHEEADRVMGELQTLGLKTKSAVVVLHHALGGYDDGNMPIPLSGIKNKVTKTSSLVLTLSGGADDSQLFASVVKNRFGPKDPLGLKVRAELRVDGARNLITDSHIVEVA